MGIYFYFATFFSFLIFQDIPMGKIMSWPAVHPRVRPVLQFITSLPSNPFFQSWCWMERKHWRNYQENWGAPRDQRLLVGFGLFIYWFMYTLMLKVGCAGDLIKIKKNILWEPKHTCFAGSVNFWMKQLLNKFLKEFLLAVLKLMQNNACPSEVFQHDMNLNRLGSIITLWHVLDL